MYKQYTNQVAQHLLFKLQEFFEVESPEQILKIAQQNRGVNKKVEEKKAQQQQSLHKQRIFSQMFEEASREKSKMDKALDSMMLESNRNIGVKFKELRNKLTP